jgi:serine/threonine protein kinase
MDSGKNKIIRTIGTTEHVLYEVSAEILTVLEEHDLFRKLFEGVDRYSDRIVESLSHTQSEAQRAKSAHSLMRALWCSYMLGGPYPVPSLLPEFEFSRIFYPKYRDHTVHQLRVLLLGLYIYSTNSTVRNAVRCAIANLHNSAQHQSTNELDRRFLRVWLLAATYHDQGYVFEIDVPQDERSLHLGRVFAELNSFFTAPMHNYLRDYLQVTLDDTTERRARFGLGLPQAFFAECFDDLLFNHRTDRTVLAEIEPLASSCHLAPNNTGLTHYLEMARATSPRDGRPPYIDHGIASAVMLARCHTELHRYACELARHVSTGQLQRFIPSDSAQQAIEMIASELEAWTPLVNHAAAAIAVHNIDRTLWDSAVSTSPRYGLTLDLFSIPLSTFPLGFLLFISDTLQDWDRPRFVFPKDDQEYMSLDQHLLVVASERGIGVRTMSPASSFAEVRRVLLENLSQTDVDSLVHNSPELTYPDKMSREGIDEAAARTKLEIQRRAEELRSKWNEYQHTVESARREDESPADCRSRRIRHFRTFLQWCESCNHEYLQPTLSADIGEIYSLILAEINDLNFVMENTVIDGRTLIERIGSGGYGTVFRTTKADGTVEAMKVFHTSNFKDPELADRFRRGFDSMRSLQHPQITRVHEFSSIPRGYYMEYIEGDNIAAFLRQAGRSDVLRTAEERLGLLVDICRVLEYAHKETVIHRDIKPENILLRWSDERQIFEPILTDFDLAWFNLAVPITASGTEVVGSILYAAPEQKRARPDVGLVHRPTVDVYSMGRLMYFVFSGSPPDEGVDLGEAMFQAVQHRYREVTIRSFAWKLKEIYQKATHISPERRYQTIMELRRDLASLHGLLRGSSEVITDEVFLFEVAVRLNLARDHTRDAALARESKLHVELINGQIDLELVRYPQSRPYADVRFTLILPETMAAVQKGTFPEARATLNRRIEGVLKESPFAVIKQGRGGGGYYAYHFRIAIPELTSDVVDKMETFLHTLGSGIVR